MAEFVTVLDDLALAFHVWPSVWIVACGVIGAVLASMGGVLVARLPHQLGWREDAVPGLTIWSPRSHCDGCKRDLDNIDLIPVFGWLIRKGRCPSCGVRISALYPLSEAATGVAFAVIAAVWGPSPTALWLMTIVWSCLVISWIDIREFIIPEVLTVPLFWAGLLLSPFEADVSQRAMAAFIASAAVWFAFKLVGFLKQDTEVSGGDVMLAAVAGSWIGTDGVVPFLLMSTVGAVIFSIPYRRQGVTVLPWGPALCVSWFLVAALSVRWPQ